jgi:glycosyltransferase involved in cell wall biosynthesis
MEWTEVSPKGVERELREYALADQVFVPSKFVLESFRQRNFSDDKLFKSSFGVNLDKFKYERKSFNMDQPLKCIFTSARSVRKGVRYLTEAFKAFDANQAKLVLVGDQEVGIEAFLPRGENVEIHNHVPQDTLLSYYRQSDVFIHPSIEEGLALVQAQAMAAGLVLICTTNTGGEDLLMLSNEKPQEINDGIFQYPAGFVVPSHDAKSISFCIELLCSDRALLKGMQIEAFALCEWGNNWRDYARRNARAYAGLLKKNSK